MTQKLDALLATNSLPDSIQDSALTKSSNEWATLTDAERKSAQRPIAEMAISMNIEQSRQQTEVVMSSLCANGWTIDRIHRAVRSALSSREALREIKFAGAITPLVLIEAEQAEEEAASPILGKCFTPYCNREARVREWGEVYCKPCHEMHMEKIRARRLRFTASKQEYAALLQSRAEHLRLTEAQHERSETGENQ